ncbi:MAG: prepilin-type N-terminal cleavage/methylation domain-containing protein, partial [Verrucomicrobiota bacterium]
MIFTIKNTIEQANRPGKRGLTLVELLVVLSVVAVVSTVAMRSLVGQLDQTNYDANLSQLSEIEFAVLGDEETASFVGDIGRLPQVIGTDPETQLAELWQIESLSAYSINTPTGDSEIRLGTGWRGPYLNLGLTRTEITDGFGFDFVLTQTTIDMVDVITAVESLGLSGTVG